MENRFTHDYSPNSLSILLLINRTHKKKLIFIPKKKTNRNELERKERNETMIPSLLV